MHTAGKPMSRSIWMWIRRAYSIRASSGGKRPNFQIDQVLYKCRASSKKVGGGGIRYTVLIRGRESYLFQEGSKWFVEAKET